MLQLVVARHSENLQWLGNIPPRIVTVVYDKSGEPATGSLFLENAGREAHTYLHHICERYADLADITVFCQGKPFDHTFDFHQILRNLAKAPEAAPPFSWLGHTIDTDSNDGALFRSWSKNPGGKGLDLNAFHRALWGEDGPDEYSFHLGAQFAVRRELVWQRPRSFYERARKLALDFPDAAHCFERCWDQVFNMGGVASQVLAGRKTLHLKRMKREASSTSCSK